MDVQHDYQVAVEWLGDRGSGTSGYKEYGREHEVRAPGKPAIAGASDPSFFGDASRWNPEELLLAALAQCHLLSYLHVAQAHGVIVVAYTDAASGTMLQTPDGGGHFTEVVLRPSVVVRGTDADAELAQHLHEEAAAKCFIASSVNFPVRHEPEVTLADEVPSPAIG